MTIDYPYSNDPLPSPTAYLVSTHVQELDHTIAPDQLLLRQMCVLQWQQLFFVQDIDGGAVVQQHVDAGQGLTAGGPVQSGLAIFVDGAQPEPLVNSKLHEMGKGGSCSRSRSCTCS